MYSIDISALEYFKKSKEYLQDENEGESQRNKQSILIKLYDEDYVRRQQHEHAF